MHTGDCVSEINHPYSLYLHIPFCVKRCSYCDFNTYAGRLALVDDYVEALCIEIEKVGKSRGEQIVIHTIYFGGGTPSLISASDLKKVLGAIKVWTIWKDDIEISIEANPGTLSRAVVEEMAAAGLNRISIGMQSADPQELSLLGRIHTQQEVYQSVGWARQIGLSNINLDLLYGIPGQDLSSWESSLLQAVSLKPEHLSLYALTLEGGVLLERLIKAGSLPPQQEDLMADMYDLAGELLETHGYHQYEISNWVRFNSRGELLVSRHNLQYWRNLPYLGFGAGAHGYAGGVRTENVRRIGAYQKRCREGSALAFPAGPALKNRLVVDRWLEMQETMMLGLRLTQEGISKSGFAERFGIEVEEVFVDQVELLIGKGLLSWSGDQMDSLRLTPYGRLLGNQVFMHFVGNEPPQNIR